MCDHCGCRELTFVQRLMNEHDRLRELSGRIHRELAAGRLDAARASFTDLLVVLGPHVVKEEGALFPTLSGDPALADHVAVLEAEHADLYDAVDDLEPTDPAVAPSEEWADGVLRILHELDEHMFKEDFGLFPAAIASVDGADWDAMDRWEARHQPAGEATARVS